MGLVFWGMVFNLFYVMLVTVKSVKIELFCVFFVKLVISLIVRCHIRNQKKKTAKYSVNIFCERIGHSLKYCEIVWFHFHDQLEIPLPKSLAFHLNVENSQPLHRIFTERNLLFEWYYINDFRRKS